MPTGIYKRNIVLAMLIGYGPLGISQISRYVVFAKPVEKNFIVGQVNLNLMRTIRTL